MLFADWQGAESLLHEALEEKYHKAIPELAVYLVEGVGNSTRIDYGTGGCDLCNFSQQPFVTNTFILGIGLLWTALF